MSKIEEMALKEYPINMVGYSVKIRVGEKPTELDYNEEKRKAFVEGANAVLEEIENILSLGYNTMATVDLIEEKVKELKG